MKKKIAFLMCSSVAVGALMGLVGCNKSYDERLVVYNWEDYIYEGTDENGNYIDDEGGIVERFESYYKEKYGKTVKVDYETFSTNEDMYAQISLGSISPDLICPSDYMIQKMANEDMLEKFSYNDETGVYGDSLKNFADYGSPFIKDRFKEAKLSDGKTSFLQYAVPYFWGTMGFTYNPEFKKNDGSTIENPEEIVASWECLWNNDIGKIISLKDSVRDTYVAAIFHVYKDEIAALDESASDYNAKLSEIFNRCDDATINKVKEALIEAKNKTVYGLEVDEGKNDIVNGDYFANLAWSGDAIFAMDSAEENSTPLYLNYSLPEEGSNVWFDGWCMPKGANKELAEEFVNFICKPSNAALCMDSVGYTSPIVGEEMWELVNDWYAADEGVETYTVDLGFYFGADADYTIEIDAEEEGRQFDAQYPTEDVLNRCCIMKDFGDQTTKVEAMWKEVKGSR